MPTTGEFHSGDPHSITVDRDQRQRRELPEDHIRDLMASIQAVGQLHPIVVTRNLRLVAGECRLEACRRLGRDIFWQYLDEVDPLELQAIELEENVKRRDLHWQDRTRAIATYHDIKLKANPEWDYEATGKALGMVGNWIYKNVRVARALTQGNARVKAATTMPEAFNIVERELERAIDHDLSRIMAEDGLEPETLPEIQAGDTLVIDGNASTYPGNIPATVVPQPKIRPAELDLLHQSFLEWAPQFQGRPFNFLHCDFPYGINYDKAKQGNVQAHGTYEDTPELYFELVQCLCQNLDRLLLSSAHMMFWLSANHLEATKSLFASFTNLTLVDEYELIWFKTDNRGLLPDATRGPRRVYEKALMYSRGDRKIVQAVANCYGAPTGKAGASHLSEKPEPMLRHFFRMFVEPGMTEVLDPTCGSGSALRAAEGMGANRVLGLDVSEDNLKAARELLQTARNKAAAAKALEVGK